VGPGGDRLGVLHMRGRRAVSPARQRSHELGRRARPVRRDILPSVLFDDYVLRQVRKIAELIAVIGARSAGQTYADVDAELADAYRSLLGMEREMADRIAPASLARMLGDPRQVDALARLMTAHGDLCDAREQHGAALRLWERALELAEDEALRREL